MNITEFTKPKTAASLNESLAKTYGEKLNLAKFTNEQLEDFRNRLRTKISQVETNESYDSVLKDGYQKDRMFLDVIVAELEERYETNGTVTTIKEGAEDEAEIVMATKDMVDRVTGWMEDTAEMQTESMLELADAIRDEMGSEKSEEFVNMMKPALEQLYSTMETTRQTLTQGVGMLTGEGGAPDMMGADDEMDMDMEPTDDMDMDTDVGDLEGGDEFGATDVAAGGEEEAGREKRESVQRSKKK